MALQLNRSGKDTSAASTFGTGKSGTGKPAKGAPVTAHPLFPAVVALWFGALFGLGSLAVRVGLLESMVLATRIDTLIPAAAPPLGISARILLALTLAALGALLGAAIARRIAAPKTVVRERKRKAALSPEESVNLRSRDAHPDAPARRPLSINDALGDDAADAERGPADPLAGRRRSALAVETDDTFELHELAPLPGGNPQILPMTDGTGAQFDESPLELGDYAEAAEHQLAPPSAAPSLDWHHAAPSSAQAEPASQVFHADGERATEFVPNFAPPSDAVSGRQVFGMSHPQPDEVLDELGITDAEFEPLPAAEPASMIHGDASFPAATTPAAHEVPSAPAVQSEPINSEPVDPAVMPMTDLAQRLAQSMERRRARVAQAADAATAAAVVVAPETESGVAANVPSSPASPEEPASLARFGGSPEIGAEPAAAPSFAHPNDVPFLPLAALPSAAASTPAFEPVPAPITSLNFAAPSAPSGDESAVAAPGLAVVHAQPFGDQQQALPAALRPLSFDAYSDDDDGDDFGGFLPPRSFPGVGRVMPVPAAPAAPFEAPPEPVQNPFAAQLADEAAADDKFSSLLDLGRSAEPRQTFVRIEDSAEPALAIEPVVIFPGQVARPAAALAVPTEFDPAAASFRQFNSPSSADAGQGVAQAASAPHDQGETERALRAALANLQRMSGAA